jgi:hypothetical protein
MPHTRRLVLALLTLLLVGPAMAEVVGEGKPSKGFYWQKIKQSNGKVVYQCRSTTDGKFQKADSCKKAGAVQPH